MSDITKIYKKIEKIETILREIKSELTELQSIKKNEKSKSQKATKQIPSKEELIEEYNRLYKEYIENNNKQIIVDFVNSKTKNYLKIFFKANSIPVDVSKTSKNKLQETILQWFNQRKIISKR